MFHQWEIAHFDLSAFVRVSIDNFMGAFGGAQWIGNYESINPKRPMDESEKNSIAAQHQALEAESRKEFETPVVWSPF
jgi:hypothetical protein